MQRRAIFHAAIAGAIALAGCRGGPSPLLPAPGPAGDARTAEAAAPDRAGNVVLHVLVPLPSSAAGLSGTVYTPGSHVDPIASFQANIGAKGRCKASTAQRLCTHAVRIPPGGPYDVAIVIYDRFPLGTKPGAKVLGSATTALTVPSKGKSEMNLATGGALAGTSISLFPPSLHAFDHGKVFATVSGLDASGNVLVVSKYTDARGGKTSIALSSSLPRPTFFVKPGIFAKPLRNDAVIHYRVKRASATIVENGVVDTVSARAAVRGAKATSATFAILKPAVTNVSLPEGGPTPQPAAITVGPDGALWFCEYGSGKIGRVTTQMQVTGEYGPFRHPQSIANAAGALWIAENDGAGNIDRIATDGSTTAYPLAINTYPNGISVGLDKLWFGSNNFNYVSTITAAGSYGAQLKLATSNGYPDHSVRGSDGNQYFTLAGTGQVAKVSQLGTLLATYTEPGTNKSPEDIVTGPDGALWFSDVNQSAIYRMTTAGAFTKFPISASIGLSGPLAFGPDEKLWFAGGLSDAGRLDTVAGTAIAFSLVNGGLPYGIALGPDGAFYLTEFGSGQISRLQ